MLPNMSDGKRLVQPADQAVDDTLEINLMRFGGAYAFGSGLLWVGYRWFTRPTADYDFPAELLAAADVVRALALVGLIVGAIVFGLGAGSLLIQDNKSRPARSAALEAVKIRNRHLTNVPIPEAYAEVVATAVKAEETIVGTEVWSTSLFDSHHVRLGLSAEVDLIVSRMRRLTDITHGTDTSATDPSNKGSRLPRGWLFKRPCADEATIQAVQQIEAATMQRVAALEEYRDQVLACDREYRRLHATELNASRLTDLLATTGADQAKIDHLKTLSLESAAATDALRDVLALMMGTVSTLRRDSSSKN